MTISAIARRWQTKLVAALAAVAMIFGMAVVAADDAEASPNRAHLRAGCTWDPYNYWVQHCMVWSPAMNTHVPVQVVPSRDGGNSALYLLGGLRNSPNHSNWSWQGHAPRTFENSNINLVMPGNGMASFWTDWQRPSSSVANGPFSYKWETFLTQELPVYLQNEFGIRPNDNSIAGLSMGASAALSLAYNHRDKFNQVVAMSGYLHTTAPGMHAAIGIALLDAGGYNAADMWGAPLSEAWRRNDPFLNIDKMKGLDIQILSANGVPSYWSQPEALYRIPNDLMGIGLEALSRASTLEFEAAARAQGLDFDVQYSPDGIHSYDLWERDLRWVKPRILNHQNAW
ncbi:alpha/beta hydrolase [Corynebacterium sp. 335C]